MAYQVFARRYRPRTFEEMVGQKAVVQTLQNAIKSGRVAQAYLFSGTRGVGKTTAARILAKALNCVQGPTPTPCNVCEFCTAIQEDRLVDVLEIDGASNRGIEDIRMLREAVKYKAMHSLYKVVIIDEVHQVTREGFNALLKTLEEPPEKTVFIFATTEFQKVPATIVSRCQHFEFKKVSQKDLINHLADIARRENLTLTPFGLGLIARAAEGSLRDGLSLLDQAAAFCGETIGDVDLKEILGTINPDLLFEFSSAVFEEAPGRIFPLVEKVIDSGYDLRAFLKELIGHFRELLLVRTMAKPQDILYTSDDDLAQLRRQAEKAGEEDLLRCLQALQNGEASFRYSSHLQIAFETLLVKLCHFKKIISVKDALQELEALNQGGASAADPRVRSAVPGLSAAGPRPYGLRRPPSAGEAGSSSAGLAPKTSPSAAAGVPALPGKGLGSPVPTSLGKGPGSPAPGLVPESTSAPKARPLPAPPAPPSSIEDKNPAFKPSAGKPFPPNGSPGPVPASSVRDRETDNALRHPNVRLFMDKFKARVVSVEPVKPPRTDEEE